MSNFEPNAIIRGFQLTVVGTVRALRNPELFKYNHFRQAAIAVAAGIAIHLIVQFPIVAVKFLLWIASLVSDLDQATWDDKILGGLNFMSNFILQVPFLLMTLMRYITPTLDEIFMESVKWVDETYVQKHQSDDQKDLRAMYYPNLVMYSTKGSSGTSKKLPQAIMAFFKRYSRKVATWIGVYLLSFVPVIGRFVMPAVSFYAFKKAVGPVPAAVIFGTGILLPKWILVAFLQSYFSSRSLMRELLEPYFCRIRFDKEQKRRWFLDREGVLFGFAFGFTVVLKTPFIGVLMYGIAQASTAYLITKITDPPPPPAQSEGFAETQVTWKNKHEFLRLPLDSLDKHIGHHDNSHTKKYS
ncbi:hypothetical protein VTN00DRAFT_2331 [Thermoascus crustaceus]|uniref:uncharacterized protein n=1 Tax=Thermoascus crustaceus TaxID=5088 RepID=UPI0037422BCE